MKEYGDRDRNKDRIKIGMRIRVKIGMRLGIKIK